MSRSKYAKAKEDNNINSVTGGGNAGVSVIDKEVAVSKDTQPIAIAPKSGVNAKKSTTPKKDLDAKVKVKVDKLGVSIKEDNKEKIDKLAKRSGNKPNTAIIKVLSDVFDGRRFNVDIDSKSKIKVTSYNLPIEMIDSIEKISERTGYNKSEVFNMLLETALDNYY